MTRDDLLYALQSNNVQALLRVIRFCEGTDDENGYLRMFGGALMEAGLTDHPRQAFTKRLGGLKEITSTAAGAYQILQKTWGGLQAQFHFPDFSPASQDQAAVALIAGRGALQDVIGGNIHEAIRKCANEWASLPGSPYGQPTKPLDKCLETYRGYGGILATDRVTAAPQASKTEAVGR